MALGRRRFVAAAVLTTSERRILTPGAFFVIAGVLRCVYNGALFGHFRHIHPPEAA
jgi:hypothetical protein